MHPAWCVPSWEPRRDSGLTYIQESWSEHIRDPKNALRTVIVVLYVPPPKQQHKLSTHHISVYSEWMQRKQQAIIIEGGARGENACWCKLFETLSNDHLGESHQCFPKRNCLHTRFVSPFLPPAPLFTALCSVFRFPGKYFCALEATLEPILFCNWKKRKENRPVWCQHFGGLVDIEKNLKGMF